MEPASPIKSPPAADTEKPNEEELFHRTLGEKWFKVLRFAIAETTILALTAVIAFVSRHGKEDYHGVPNVFKKMQGTFEKMLDVENKKGTAKLLAASAASTMVTFHGGNLFAPGMKLLEDKRHNIVDAINERWGKPGELEAGKERLRHEEKETWGDVIKGRLGAWLLVFTSFVTADLVAGESKEHPGKRKFDVYTDKFGKWMAGFTAKGKETIAKIPEGQLLSEELKANRTFRFGQILALDIFATTAAIAIWNTISKLSAIARKRKSESESPAPLKLEPEKNPQSGPVAELQASPSFTSRIGDRPADFRALAGKEQASSGMALP